MVTPEILADIILTLSLFVPRFFLIDNINPTFAADYNIIRTDFFYAGTHFHADHYSSSVAANDTLLRLIICGT